jgi:ornithine carbamoyltransferase
MKHILSDFDLSMDELKTVLELSTTIKQNPTEYTKSLSNKTLLMLFELPSLRTRISFEAGMTQLGGHAIFFGVGEGGFTRGEGLEDGVKVLSRYADCIMARVLKHQDLERIGKISTVPIINGMTEKYHPCQNMADLLTIQEKKGDLKGLNISYVGDGGCNTASSTMIGCSSMGMKVTIVCPDHSNYSPNPEILSIVEKGTGNPVKISHEPEKGVDGADIIYTDVWVSAGMEEEKKHRMEYFPPYQVNMNLVENAKDDVIVMHCMPAHRGLEITSDVMDSGKAVLIDQAENRMHAQKGLLYWLLT